MQMQNMDKQSYIYLPKNKDLKKPFPFGQLNYSTN